MSNAPHVHTIKEVQADLARIEHNASGPGSPSIKKSGPPTGIEGGSVGNENWGNQPGVTNHSKGDDYAGKRKD